LGRALDSARRDGIEHALCYLDLDNFKRINDICGDAGGDEMLRQLSTLLRGTIRRRDTLARLGGGEFGVLLEHCELAQARTVAANIAATWRGSSSRGLTNGSLSAPAPDSSQSHTPGSPQLMS
jgi:diguanylate cyclase (GGDEF)-like protein